MSRFTRDSVLRSGLLWAVLAAGSFGLAGFLATTATLQTPLVGLFGSEWSQLPHAAALAAGLVGGGCWWLAVERPGRRTRSRGALVGLLTGLLAHPVTWTFLFVSQDPDAVGNLLRDGTLSAVFLFTYFGLALTGWVTVGIGVLCGLVVGVARERFETEDHEREPLSVVVTKYLVMGGVAVPVAVVAMVVPRAILASLIVATLIPIPVLRRLPVVRTFLLQSYRLDGKDDGDRSGGSFLLRHGIVTVSVGAVYFVGLFVFGSLTWELFAGSAVPISQTVSLVTVFPMLFVAIGLPATLGLNYRKNRWAPTRSIRQATREWLTVLLVVAVVYAAGSVVLFEPLDL